MYIKVLRSKKKSRVKLVYVQVVREKVQESKNFDMTV